MGNDELLKAILDKIKKQKEDNNGENKDTDN